MSMVEPGDAVEPETAQAPRRASVIRRWRLPQIAGVLIVLWFVGFRGSSTTGVVPPPTVADVGSISVAVPERVDAGDPFEITIEGLESDAKATITFDTGYGLRTVDVAATGAAETVMVEPFEGPASGVVIVTVAQGREVMATSMIIDPGPPTDAIDVYLGPRTVIADAEHFVMIVAVPTDIWGNPVAAETPVDFLTTRPDLRVETKRYETEDLLAWYEVFSRTVAGRTRIATESLGAGAGERDFLEVAGTPAPFTLALTDPLLPADGHALLTIRTELLADRFGNVLPDGTVVVLDADGVTGIRRTYGQTVDGYGEFVLEVPDRPGRVTLQASASGTSSEPLVLQFATAIASITGQVEVTPKAALVHVGPVRSVRASFVPEGTIATVTAADGSSALVDLSLGVGTASFAPDTDLTTATIEVLGTRKIVRPVASPDTGQNP